MGVENYTIGKGLLSVNGAFMGNAPQCSFEINVETRTRYRAAASACVRYPADVQIVGKTGKLKFQLDEFTTGALSLATDGVMGATVVLVQTNLIGPQRTYTFSNVNIWPSGFPMISDEFGVLDFEGDVIFDASLNWGSIS
jgi:hypothetical protein